MSQEPQEPQEQAAVVPRNDASSREDLSTDTAAVSTRRRDPFLYFSNQDRRLAYLTHDLNDDVNPQEDAFVEQDERKSRLTFELHPSLLLEDLLEEMADNMDPEVDEDSLERFLFGAVSE